MPQPRHATLATVALILGGIAIGTTEFVTMGLLPEIAAGVSVDIPAAGHTISAYAAGVVLGAPLLAVLGATWPRKALLIGLMAAFTVGNVLSALAPSYETARRRPLRRRAAARGVLRGGGARRRRPRRARARPAGPSAGSCSASRSPTSSGCPARRGWGRTSAGARRTGSWPSSASRPSRLVAYAVPHLARDRTKTVRNELSALTSLQVWLTLGVGAVGFGGMFAMYSYIAPTITDVTGLSSSAVPIFLLVFGVPASSATSSRGGWATGRSSARSSSGWPGWASGSALFALVAPYAVPALIVLALISVLASVLVINLQLRLMQVAGSAQTLAAASNHAALNLANALGAWVGGVVIAAG